jgi:hypothetical protein
VRGELMVICGELCGVFVVGKNMPTFLNKSELVGERWGGDMTEVGA